MIFLPSTLDAGLTIEPYAFDVQKKIIEFFQSTGGYLKMLKCLRQWYINCLKILSWPHVMERWNGKAHVLNMSPDAQNHHMIHPCIKWYSRTSRFQQLLSSSRFNMYPIGLIPPTSFSWTLDLFWVLVCIFVHQGPGSHAQGGWTVPAARRSLNPVFFFVCFASQFARYVVYQTTSNNLVLYHLQTGLRGLLQSQELCDVVLVSSGPEIFVRDRGG